MTRARCCQELARGWSSSQAPRAAPSLEGAAAGPELEQLAADLFADGDLTPEELELVTKAWEAAAPAPAPAPPAPPAPPSALPPDRPDDTNRYWGD